jgi:hypothetical protein
VAVGYHVSKAFSNEFIVSSEDFDANGVKTGFSRGLPIFDCELATGLSGKKVFLVWTLVAMM